jgi:hydrogenase maturation factor HypF (carbamoyltransferase family)
MKRMSAKAIRDENVFDATMNAVIIYDEFDYATKANAMLERAAHRTDETTHWSVKPWRVDMLKLSPVAEAALAEAAEAHLIVLAVRQVQSLLPWLVDWLERWATCRQVQEAALAVWDGGNADTRFARATPELSQFAGRHGLSFIFDDTILTEDESAVSERSLHEREVTMPSTLGQLWDEPIDCQHWGINE